MEESFKGFVHRFTDESEIVSFLFCISELLKRGSTLESMFHSFHEGDSWETAEKFTTELLACGGREKMYLLPKPSKGSACKRLALFLRWMVRSDEVDPGGWTKISPDSLFIPLDTHMFNICNRLGLCSQKQANARAVKEITEAFKVISADDPVRYDFSLTRFGIRSDMQLEELFKKWETKS